MTNIEAEKEIQELRQEVERLKAELANVKSLMSVMGRGGSSSVSGNGGTGKVTQLPDGRFVSAITISKDGNTGAPQIMFGGGGGGGYGSSGSGISDCDPDMKFSMGGSGGIKSE